MSAAQLAQRLEIEEGYLQKILHGEIAPSSALVGDLARGFGQNPRVWLFETEVLPQLQEIQALYPGPWRTFLEGALQTLTAPGVPTGQPVGGAVPR